MTANTRKQANGHNHWGACTTPCRQQPQWQPPTAPQHEQDMELVALYVEGHRPPPVHRQLAAAPAPRPAERPRSRGNQTKVRQTYSRLTAPTPKPVPQWQPQLEAKKAAKVAAAERAAAKKAALDSAVDLRPKADTKALAERLGITL